MHLAENFYLALFVTIFAGLSTIIGSTIAFFFKTTNRKALAFSLGISAGVMVYISFVEILPKSVAMIDASAYKLTADAIAVIGFFVGVIIMLIVDRIIPDVENPHEYHLQEEMDHSIYSKRDLAKLKRAGLMMAGAVGVHNFPEGLVTFLAVLQEPVTGIFIAFAIAVHNIPEGISISVPIYYATGSKKKAFIYSSLSGIAEPVGAILGYLVLYPFLNDNLIGVVFAAVGGVMVYISIDELLPSAQKYGEHHISIYGFIVGMMVMALSLLMFQVA